MGSPRGWEGTDGSDTALILGGDGRLNVWTSMGVWIELHTDEEPGPAAERFADSHGLVPMSEERLAYLLGIPLSEDETAAWGDSQERT